MLVPYTLSEDALHILRPWGVCTVYLVLRGGLGPRLRTARPAHWFLRLQKQLRILVKDVCNHPRSGNFVETLSSAHEMPIFRVIMPVDISNMNAITFYATLKFQCTLEQGQDLNLRPSAYEADELPDCYHPAPKYIRTTLDQGAGLEPATCGTKNRRSTN